VRKCKECHLYKDETEFEYEPRAKDKLSTVCSLCKGWNDIDLNHRLEISVRDGRLGDALDDILLLAIKAELKKDEPFSLSPPSLVNLIKTVILNKNGPSEMEEDENRKTSLISILERLQDE